MGSDLWTETTANAAANQKGRKVAEDEGKSSRQSNDEPQTALQNDPEWGQWEKQELPQQMHKNPQSLNTPNSWKHAKPVAKIQYDKNGTTPRTRNGSIVNQVNKTSELLGADF